MTNGRDERDEERGFPYLWPTWVAGLLAGEAHCAWAAWYRAHYKAEKREDDRGTDLVVWRAEHAAMVHERADKLRRQGWRVAVEDQNRFKLKGRATVVSGCPDLVATRPDDATLLVEDCKTGKPKGADFCQVCLYLVVLPLVDKSLAWLQPRGTVVYREGDVGVSAAQVETMRPEILAQFQAIGRPAPPRTPSVSECARCDIAKCPERLGGALATAETAEF